MFEDRFLENKYTKTYFRIINRAKYEKRCKGTSYFEIHHILPKSMYPEFKNLNKNEWNGVLLTGREHYICHRLLIKMVDNIKDKNRMRAALRGMLKNECGRTFNSYQYEYIKTQLSLAMKGRIVSKETREKISNIHKGKKKSPEHVEKIASKNRGRLHSKEIRERMSFNRVGKTHSEETKKKISNSNKGKHNIKWSLASKENAFKNRKGRKFSQKAIDASIIAKTKKFKLTCNDGTEFVIDGIYKFSQEFGHNADSFRKLRLGQIPRYKNFIKVEIIYPAVTFDCSPTIVAAPQLLESP